MIAHIDESAPPYKFQLVKGGKFNIDNQYGTITHQKFCLVGIGKTFHDNSSDDTSSEEDDPPSDDEIISRINQMIRPILLVIMKHTQMIRTQYLTNTTSDNETHTNTTSDNETHTNDQTTVSDSGSG